MERPLPLEISGAASWNDAYADVASCVHWDADDGTTCGCAAHSSLRRSRWHHHRQVIDSCTACLPSHHDCAAPGFLPEWRQDVPGAERVRAHPVVRLWVDCLIKPNILALQLLRLPTPAGQPLGDATPLRPTSMRQGT